MNFAMQSVAVAAMTLCAVSPSALAADVSASSESAITAVSQNPAAQIAQADIRSASMPSAGAMQDTAIESLDSGKRDARAAAKQGPDALRRYVDRTRMVYALDYREFARF